MRGTTPGSGTTSYQLPFGNRILIFFFIESARRIESFWKEKTARRVHLASEGVSPRRSSVHRKKIPTTAR